MEDVELVPEKEKIEDGKEGCPAFHCDLCDAEIVYKIAQMFLPGLAAACVDNTTGGIFKSPASVAVDLRKEMIDYLTQRSESFVADSIILEDGSNIEVSDHPYDIIADFIDDFASSKRNFFSRVSGWLMSEKREDNIDDFAQEMEINGFWLMDRRELIAQTLVKNVDFKNTFHCDKRFNTADELAKHVVNCDFRSMNCTNQGCAAIFCASHMEDHDSVCPFKIIPCEQKCSDNIMRREMDRHCITVCPMKLVNCPFYALGCQSTIPRNMIQKHCSDDLQLHLVYALRNVHKGVSEEDLKQRVDQIVQLNSGQLGATKDARSLTLRVRDIDAKLGPLEVNTVKTASKVCIEDANNITSESTEAETKAKVEAENKVIEESNLAKNDGGEKSANATNKAGEECIEDANNITSESTEAEAEAKVEAENKVIEESNLAKIDGGEKSAKTTNKAGEECIEDSNNITSESTEAEAEAKVEAENKVIEESSLAKNDGGEKSANATNKAGEEYIEDANNITSESTEAEAEAEFEAENKFIEESNVAKNVGGEKSANATNKDAEVATETSNLTTHASEGAQTQVST